MSFAIPSTTSDYLLEGDPAIRWQTMRDLLNLPAEDWRVEQARMLSDGWGARFLESQGADGNWPKARWTDTVWTMCTLVTIGMPPRTPGMVQGFENIVGRLMPLGKAVSRKALTEEMDLCHLGFWLRIGARFLPKDERLPALTRVILELQMADGGWNCRIRTKRNVNHSSFHTTFNVLEGLKEAAIVGIVDLAEFKSSESRALEFMLQHLMYRSDKTGEIIDQRFLDLAFPSYWHYNVLRGLDYLRETDAIHDPRLKDALDYLESRRKPNGRWPVEKRIPGDTLFDMEPMGQDSRWNTLRALRVLKAACR